MRSRFLLLLFVASALGAPRLGAQAPCTTTVAPARAASGWAALREGRVESADSVFAKILADCPEHLEALIGQGYVRLRQGDLALAEQRFSAATARAPENYDALTGAGLVAWRKGDLAAARRAFVSVLAVAPGDSTAKQYLERIPVPVDAAQLPGRPRANALDLVARTGPRRFELRQRSGAWEPFWIKAVNLGAALPGKHPSEFPPDDGTYDEWVALTARMGANTLRVYTIHPPHFYTALDRWNQAHPDSVVWLIHGVWTELPPGKEEEQYDDPAWSAEFLTEMRHVVDLLHGNAAIQPRPGHSSGLYTTDVSRWVVGYIIGREWEPYSVVAYAKMHPTVRDFSGRYVTVRGGNAVDVWLAQFCEAMIGYEMSQYNAQRPIAYTNWPTLDPLIHPTESTKGEEIQILRRRGETVAEESREFDNDAIGLDAIKWSATAEFPAGVFASYHAYPYYPDFLVLDPKYARARSSLGPSNYFGYLRELVEHHGTMPVVISEYGVPSSRGNAHLQPQGFHHGGHDEQAQARINARLTREIHEAGAAGAGLFAIIDEWFKKNWLVIDFEQPLERNRLWLNALDAEQNYGVVAMRPGLRDSAITIDGDTLDWHGSAPWLSTADRDARVRALHVRSDEAYVYLRLTVDSLDWNRTRYLVGIDSYDAERGDRRLPYTGSANPTGLEFVLDLKGPSDSRLLVDSPYNLYRLAPIVGAQPPAVQAIWNRPFRTLPNSDGVYDTLWVVPNRRRVGRDGTVYPEQRYDRNFLRYDRQQNSTLADWYANAATKTIEVRIPWGLLHVLDPSSRTVLFGSEKATDPEGLTTEGFRFVVESYDPRGTVASRGLLWKQEPSATLPPLWSWPTWEIPRWYAERKPLFEAMREAFRSINP